jgi:hypothetical protein
MFAAKPMKTVSRIFHDSFIHRFALQHRKFLTIATIKDGPFNYINGKRTPVSSAEDAFDVLNPATGKVSELNFINNRNPHLAFAFLHCQILCQTSISGLDEVEEAVCSSKTAYESWSKVLHHPYIR